MRSSRFEAEAKKRSRIRFPRIVFREKNSQGVHQSVFGSTNIFFLFPLSFSPPFDRGRNSGISTNCKSCASKRTKRHEESRQRTYFTFIRSLGRLNHSWPRVELSIPVAAPRLRKPTWPLVFLPIFPFETWSHPVSSFSFVRGWILIIVRPIPFPLPIIRIPRMLFEPRSVEHRGQTDIFHVTLEYQNSIDENLLSTIIRDILIPPCFLRRDWNSSGRKSLIYIPRETSIVFSARNIPIPPPLLLPSPHESFLSSSSS